MLWLNTCVDAMPGYTIQTKQRDSGKTNKKEKPGFWPHVESVNVVKAHLVAAVLWTEARGGGYGALLLLQAQRQVWLPQKLILRVLLWHRADDKIGVQHGQVWGSSLIGRRILLCHGWTVTTLAGCEHWRERRGIKTTCIYKAGERRSTQVRPQHDDRVILSRAAVSQTSVSWVAQQLCWHCIHIAKRMVECNTSQSFLNKVLTVIYLIATTNSNPKPRSQLLLVDWFERHGLPWY